MAGEILRVEFIPCAVPYVEHIHLLGFLQNPVYHAIDVRLVPVKQVPEVPVLMRRREAIRGLAQTADSIPQPQVPSAGGLGRSGADPII